MKPRKVLIVTKQVELDYYIKQHPDADVKKVLSMLLGQGLDADSFWREHQTHYSALNQVESALRTRGICYRVVQKSDLKKDDFGSVDLVIPIGGDGTFLDASHYVEDSRLVFGVNSDKKRSAGIFMAATTKDFDEKLERILGDDFSVRQMRRLEALVRNGRENLALALNEVFVGKRKSMQMGRYKIRVGGKEEYQQSSGVVSALKEGQFAWLANISGYVPFATEDKRLQFVVREPKNMGRGYELNQGFADSVELVSDDYNMIVSIDSNDRDFLFQLNKGHSVLIRPSDKPLSTVEFK